MMERRLGDLSELTTSIVSMNFNGRFKPSETKPLGKAVIQSLLGGTCVQILFGQQASFSPSSQLPHGFRIIGGEASFIAYDSRLLSPCEPGWQYRRRVHDLTSCSSKSDDDRDIGRLRGLSTLNYVACRLMSKELGIRFIAVSWFTDETMKGKRQRQLVLHKVLSFARGLSNIEQLPLILAGSFHLSATDACPVLDSCNFQGIQCTGYLANSMRRELRASNLFFYSSPPVQLSSVRPRLLRGLVKVGSGLRETYRNPEDAFYHDPVFASMKLLVSIAHTRLDSKIVSTADIHIDCHILDLNERFHLISNCSQALDSASHGTRYSRAKLQEARKVARITCNKFAKPATLDHSDILADEEPIDYNMSLIDSGENIQIQQRQPAAGRLETSTLFSSSNIFPTISKSHISILKRSDVPLYTESPTTVAGYCSKRSQREPKQVERLRNCLNRCDVIRDGFTYTEPGQISNTAATDYIAETENDDDTSSEMIINSARRLSPISEGGESSCSELSTESIKDFSDDNDTYSEIESISNVQVASRDNETKIECLNDFINYLKVYDHNKVDLETTDASSLPDESAGDQAIGNQAGNESTKYISTSTQYICSESDNQNTSGAPERTISGSGCQHLVQQRSISLESETDNSFTEHCETCINEWRSTFTPVIMYNELIEAEDERFVEGATDSDESDTYLLAENGSDSECDDNCYKTIPLSDVSESMQALLGSHSDDEKSKKNRTEKNLACMLQ